MYATVSDMIARFGETQIIRLSRPEDRTAETVDETKVNTALTDATALIDGYIRGRYLVPIAAPPAEIVRATCIIARYDLSDTERASPSEEMAKGRADVIKWLESISKELVNLDVPTAQVTGRDQVGSGPRISDRGRMMTSDNLRFS
jgi:phage gp36-like protein